MIMRDRPGEGILSKYGIQSSPSTSEASADTKPYATSNIGGMMLDVRLNNGDCFGLPYSYFMAMSFDAPGTVVLYFATHTVTIEGRNLRSIYDALLRQSVDFIQEDKPESGAPDETGTFISLIEVEESPRQT